jgi:hypothetical protein
VRGRIAGQMRAAINLAFVLVHRDAWVKVTQQVSLIDNGEFGLELNPGIYAFFAHSIGFVPIGKIIDTRSYRTVNLNIKMRVDLEHRED